MNIPNETDLDVRFEPKPGCCEDCDAELDFAAWEKQVTQ
jgi:hypothetical protein